MRPIEITDYAQIKEVIENEGEQWLAGHMLAVRDQYLQDGREFQVLFRPGTFTDSKTGTITRPDLAMKEIKPYDPEDPPIQVITDATEVAKPEKHTQWQAMQEWLTYHPNCTYLILSTALGSDVRGYLGAAIDDPASGKYIQQHIFNYLINVNA